MVFQTGIFVPFITRIFLILQNFIINLEWIITKHFSEEVMTIISFLNYLEELHFPILAYKLLPILPKQKKNWHALNFWLNSISRKNLNACILDINIHQKQLYLNIFYLLLSIVQTKWLKMNCSKSPSSCQMSPRPKTMHVYGRTTKILTLASYYSLNFCWEPGIYDTIKTTRLAISLTNGYSLKHFGNSSALQIIKTKQP